MIRQFLFLLFVVMCISTKANAMIHTNEHQELSTCKVDYTAKDTVIFNQYKQALEGKKELSLNDLMILTAKFFVGYPYKASTLEKSPERLIINLREFDCTTFVETTLALSLSIKSETPNFATFCSYLQQIRYRSDVSYLSRLHYFTDWVYENQQKGFVKDVTAEIGGKSYLLKLNFMSTHFNSYPLLKDNKEWADEIVQQEKIISLRTTYALIPKDQIKNCSSKIKNGDIVSFITKIEGLDMTHVGLTYWKNNTLTFIHASSTAKKVIINTQSLQTYIEKNSQNKGIMIIRPTK